MHGADQTRRLVFIAQGDHSKEEIFDNAADKQFIFGLLAMKVLICRPSTGKIIDLVPTLSSSDRVEDIILARGHFIQAMRLAFQTLDLIQHKSLPGVTNWYRAAECIQIDLMQYMYFLAQIFHRPWPQLYKHRVACPLTAELLYETVAEMGYKHAYREISWMYADGRFGKLKEHKRLAASWLRKAHSEDMAYGDVRFGECWAWKSKYDTAVKELNTCGGTLQPINWSRPFRSFSNTIISFILKKSAFKIDVWF